MDETVLPSDVGYSACFQQLQQQRDSRTWSQLPTGQHTSNKGPAVAAVKVLFSASAAPASSATHPSEMRAAVLWLAALAASASLAEAAIAAHEVTSLPGWDYALPSKQYSGFISAQDPATVVPGKERYLHYIFVEAENNPADAPVVLWSNGGPGCSSLEGYLMEMGPLTPDPSDPQAQRLKRNPYTWNLYANMLYLEHGVGVGFSYGNGGDIQLDDEADGNDVHWFLRNFFLHQ